VLDMPFVSTNGVLLRYHPEGNGPPLCLIMGYRLHGAVWPDLFVDRLVRRFSVLTFDNRGTGLSDKPAQGYGMHVMAVDVASLLAPHCL
jgi:3-oxoadipate enol-lactonase